VTGAGRTAVLVVAATAVLGAACRREARPFDQLAAASAVARGGSTTSDLRAGGAIDVGAPSPFQDNAWAQSEGKRLFTAYNCSGCHANGGGGIGPALIDDEWIYGYAPAAIYASIVEGRPDGMPSFRGRLPEYQVWQLVAYVHSMSGQTPIDASSGRSDHMQARPPEIIQPYQGRVRTGHK
jgi:cytochrome c oxidase cbb3-type subunit 3